jgi:predicted phage terminase large subunit-like protein
MSASGNYANIGGYDASQWGEVIKYATPEEGVRIARLAKALETQLPVHELPKTIDIAELTRLETDCAYFWKKAWAALYPVTPLVWSWHYEYIAEHLTLVKQRKLRRLIINVPPRSAKSTFATMFFPTWVWLTEPAHNFLCGSYSKDLATDHSIIRRNLITSPWYQSLFGERFRLSSDRNLTTQFSNDKGGQMLITSTGSGAEGRGGDTAILDDPMSNNQALSDAERKTANDWVTNTLYQRLNNPATGAIIIIMQRLHELDTTGYVMSKNPGEWTQIVIPLVEEARKEYSFPVSGHVQVREKDDVLQPERFTPQIVGEKKANRLVFAGQYQQRPAPLEGNLIKRSDVRYYGGIDPETGLKDDPKPSHFDRVFISADCAFKGLDDAQRRRAGNEEEISTSYVAIGVIGVRGRKRFILDVVRDHLDLDGTETVILRKRSEYRANAVLVENKANGQAVIQHLKRMISGVIEIEPQGSKIARMFAAAPEWQAGDWHVDRNAAWTEPFIQEITMFPMASFDDQADMMSQTAVYLGGSALGLPVYQDQLDERNLFSFEPWTASDGSAGQVRDKVKVLRSLNNRVIAVYCSPVGARVFLDILDSKDEILIAAERWHDQREGHTETDHDTAVRLKEFVKESQQAKVLLAPGPSEALAADLIHVGVWHGVGEDDWQTAVRRTASLLGRKKILIHRDCVNTYNQLLDYTVDFKAAQRGEEKPLLQRNEAPDALSAYVLSEVPEWRLAA